MKIPSLETEQRSKAIRGTAGDRFRLFARRYATLIGLVALVIFFGALRASIFLTVTNLRLIWVTVVEIGVVAAGQTIVFALNDFDMSVGSCASMVGIICGSLMLDQHLPWPVVIVFGLLIGCAVGAFNGFLVAYVNLNPFIVTLGALTALKGVALLYKNGTVIGGFSSSFVKIGQGLIGPFPLSVIILAVIFLIAFFVMERTTTGRRWYALGSNYDASYLAGIGVRRLRFLAFVVCGGCAALAGLLLMSRLDSAAPSMGDPLTLNSIAAVFLGMTAFKDGVANIGGTLVGVLLLGVLVNGLGVSGVDPNTQLVITGAIIIFSVALAGAAKKQRA